MSVTDRSIRRSTLAGLHLDSEAIHIRRAVEAIARGEVAPDPRDIAVALSALAAQVHQLGLLVNLLSEHAVGISLGGRGSEWGVERMAVGRYVVTAPKKGKRKGRRK